MRSFLLGCLIGLMILPLGAYLMARFGYAPVATAAPPLPLESSFARMALHARIASEAPKTIPIQPSEENYTAGAGIYRENCAVCHGLRHQPEPPAGKGMFPHPPQLFQGHGVTDDPPGETYWKAANGIRLTGMPAYRQSLSEQQLWQVSLLLANADKLPESVNALVSQPLELR